MNTLFPPPWQWTFDLSPTFHVTLSDLFLPLLNFKIPFFPHISSDFSVNHRPSHIIEIPVSHRSSLSRDRTPLVGERGDRSEKT